MSNRPEVRQVEPEPLSAAHVAPAIEALLSGYPAPHVEAALVAGIRAGGYVDAVGTARAIVRVVTERAAYWEEALQRGVHSPTVTVLGMVLLELDNQLRAWAEDDAEGRLAPIAATRARLVASLIPEPPAELNLIQSREGRARHERLEHARPDPVPAVRILQVLGASRSQAYTILRANGLPPGTTDRELPDAILHRVQARLGELRRRRALYDHATTPGRKRRSAYRLRQRRPELRPDEIPSPRVRNA